MLTFDDAVASHFTVVRPILKQYNFSATFFVTEGFGFLTNKNDYLTWEQIAELHKEGFEIGNHTRDHMGVTAAGQVRIIRCSFPRQAIFPWRPNIEYRENKLRQT